VGLWGGGGGGGGGAPTPVVSPVGSSPGGSLALCGWPSSLTHNGGNPAMPNPA
jgi:hypothetical protein